MREFYVHFHTSQDVQDFIALATRQPFPLTVGNDSYHVNASSFMGMFTLNHSQPLRVTVHCGDEDFFRLLREAERFLAT